MNPIDDPKDPAYRPPLTKEHVFPVYGAVNHPNLKEAIYQSLNSNQVVVDVGCGPGPFEYHKYQPRFIAFDAFEPESSEGMKPVDEFICSRLEHFPLNDESCDVVIMGYILEHVPQPDVFIAEAERVLKTGGWCYIAIPNHRSLEDRLFRLATKVAGSTRGPHIQRFTFENFKHLVEKSSTLKLTTWHLLSGSFLWMNHPKLTKFRPATICVLKALQKARIDLLKNSNLQLVFQKPFK